MGVGPVRNVESKLETAAPVYARCPHCGNQPLGREGDHRRIYTTPYRELGFRRVTAQCRVCEGLMHWDEGMESS